jgi:uncharacterized protein YigE (DUF2233 family)
MYNKLPVRLMVEPLKILIIVLTFIIETSVAQEKDNRFLSYVADPKGSDIQLYWKDESGQLLRSLQNLKLHIAGKGHVLIFATNAGMYKPDNSPQGLFIQHKVVITPLDTLSGNGNFYLKPNGVFYLTTENVAAVCTTTEFVDHPNIEFATQSGPMLLIKGEIHPAFKKGSTNLNIRNGIGILPNGKVLFAMSKQEVNFYDFAEFFRKMNCQYALYLDGFVSRTYLPEENWQQLDGNFGVIIGVVK